MKRVWVRKVGYAVRAVRVVRYRGTLHPQCANGQTQSGSATNAIFQDPAQNFSNFDDPWMAAPALSEDFA